MKKKLISKIAIDLHKIDEPYTGLGEYAYQFGLHLSRLAPWMKERYGIEIYFFVPRSAFHLYGTDVHYIQSELSDKYKNRYLSGFFDLFHSIHQFGRVKKLPFARKTLQTIHDINFMYEESGITREKQKAALRKKMDNAQQLISISHFVAEDIERVYGHRYASTVIYNGVTNLSAQVAAEEHYPEQGYLLHLSGLQAKKNPELLLEMMQFLPHERLIMVGNWDTAYGQHLRQRIQDLALHNVHPLSAVDTHTKALLYKDCKAFLFPSLCEGFGLPPVEAMCFGKPVFLSALTSLPEVGGNNAYYWSDLRPQQMAEQWIDNMQVWKSQEELNSAEAQQRAAGFTWEQCIQSYVQEYIRLLNLKE